MTTSTLDFLRQESDGGIKIGITTNLRRRPVADPAGPARTTGGCTRATWPGEPRAPRPDHRLHSTPFRHRCVAWLMPLPWGRRATNQGYHQE
jgi:hypothetical protein